jgi:hypothetical protein
MRNKFMNYKIKIATAVAATLLSMNSFAATETLAGTFQTVVAVSIAPTATELVINGLQLGATDECILVSGTHVDGATYMGDVTMRLDGVGTNPVGGDTTTTTGGSGCVLDTVTGGIIGLYEITGAPGSSVDIIVVNSDDPNILLTPAGCAGNYPAADNPNDDTCVLVSAAAGTVPIRLAPTSGGGLGEGQPIAGTSVVAMGGTAAALIPLTSGTPYPITFEINVAY